MRMDIGGQSDIGRRKKKNEDSWGVYRASDTPGCAMIDDGALLCVADGLGGHQGGEIASKLAVSIMRDTLRQPCSKPASKEEADLGPLPVLAAGFRDANQSIFQTNRDLKTLKSGPPMGTTLVAAVVTHGKAYIAIVGDSPCYQIREAKIIQRTEDHSWVDEQVKLGLMSRDEAERDARKNIVTRCIGTHPDVVVDQYVWELEPGDSLLLCTDGLVNMVKDADIAAEFGKSASPAEIANRLVCMANANGGKDNITVVIADIEPSFMTRMTRRFIAFRQSPSMKWALLAAALVFGAASFVAGYAAGRAGF